MKYTSPEIQMIGVQATDVITTSGLVPGGEGNNDNGIEW